VQVPAAVTTGTYVEVIEAVQRDALDSTGALFAHKGDDSGRQLSSAEPTPAPASWHSSKTSTSEPSTPPPANSSAS